MPGPPPTPTEILRMRGSWRAKTRPQEPRVAPGGTPACPDWLNAEARAVWDMLIPDLEALGILAPIDSLPLSRYCVLLTRWWQLSAVLEHAAATIDMRRVDRYWRKLGDELLRIERQFGMTPSARAALGTRL